MDTNSEQIVTGLRTLQVLERTAFAASCCERMITLYDAFHLTHEWGAPDTLRAILDRIWLGLEVGQVAFPDAKELIDNCKVLIPPRDRFKTLYASLAVNSVAALIYTLEHTISGDAEKILLVRENTVEALGWYLFAVNTANLRPHKDEKVFHDWLATTPLMKAELQKEQEDIRILSTPPGLSSPTTLSQMRKTSQWIGIHPVKRTLVSGKTEATS